MSDTFYFCRLIPPRPTFAMDMNEEERALMDQHAAHWRKHLEGGNVIIAGPVADPKGPWGLGVLRFSSNAELQKFYDNDPVLSAGIGFRMETLPLLRAMVKD